MNDRRPISNCSVEKTTGRSALVTGAGGNGIGTEICRQLALLGFKVFMNGKDSNSLGQCAAQLADEGHNIETCAFDVSDPIAVSSAIQSILERLYRIDVMIHNAAPSNPATPTDVLSDSEWNADLAVILSGAFYCCRSVIPSMVKHGFGRIVLISSSAATRGTWGRSVAYAAAKAGLHGLAVQLALEYAATGITVNVVAPSQVDTPRVRRFGRRTSESLAEHARQHVPVGRVGHPSDVASLVSYLVSDASGFVTGQVVGVDGGSCLAPGTTRPQNR